VTHRIWPGTQRLLLWGDPRSAAAYSQHSILRKRWSEIANPFVQRQKGLGNRGDRCAYADASLARAGIGRSMCMARACGAACSITRRGSRGMASYLRRTFGERQRQRKRLANPADFADCDHRARPSPETFVLAECISQSIVDANGRSLHGFSRRRRCSQREPVRPAIIFADSTISRMPCWGRVDGKYSPIEVPWTKTTLAGNQEPGAVKGQSAEYRRMAVI